MLFSNPDYPIFLIAVFFLYAMSRLGGARGMWARAALMVLLGDLVFLLVAKDPGMLWDPLGGVLYRLATAGGHHAMAGDWPLRLFGQWGVGLAVLGGAITLGRRGMWLQSDRGQRLVARGMMAAIVALGAAVAIAAHEHCLDELTDTLAAHGHVLVLFVLGVGIGAAQDDNLRPLGRILVLFVASSLFYHAWAAAMPGPYRYLLGLLLFTIVLDYFLGIWIEQSTSEVARRVLVIVSVVSNLGILFFFKYADFVTHDVLMLDVDRLNLILPAGISFHTFQSLSYTIDVYRKKLPATRSVIQFATFVLFFPQLVAGPIVRAQDLLPQLDKLPALEMEKATRGLFLILVGLFKKIALADSLAIAIVDRVFETPEHFSSVEVLAGVYGYALQIYLDFSAYSDIAIGSALVLGMTLPENFRTPYRSANLQEFWRRWHISLSTWLRDYLYIALGGNRGAEWRTYLNLSLTMLLGGLWHGASWAFIVWGGLHGFGLAITRYFQRATAGKPGAAGPLYAACVLLAVLGYTVQRTLIPSDAHRAAHAHSERHRHLAPARDRVAVPDAAVGGRYRMARSRALRAGAGAAAEPTLACARSTCLDSGGAAARHVRIGTAVPRCAPGLGRVDVDSACDAHVGARDCRRYRRARWQGPREARARRRAPLARRIPRVSVRVPRVDLLPREVVRSRARRAAPDRRARIRSRERGADADDRARGGLSVPLLRRRELPVAPRPVRLATGVGPGYRARRGRSRATRARSREGRSLHLFPILICAHSCSSC